MEMFIVIVRSIFKYAVYMHGFDALIGINILNVSSGFGIYVQWSAVPC